MKPPHNPADTRTPLDGRPYFCSFCGLGYAEFMACQESQCTLETRRTALARAQRNAEKRAAESDARRRAKRQAEQDAAQKPADDTPLAQPNPAKKPGTVEP
jgi:hypothetical protein